MGSSSVMSFPPEPEEPLSRERGAPLKARFRARMPWTWLSEPESSIGQGKTSRHSSTPTAPTLAWLPRLVAAHANGSNDALRPGRHNRERRPFREHTSEL
jgi:hypothetical protein